MSVLRSPSTVLLLFQATSLLLFAADIMPIGAYYFGGIVFCLAFVEFGRRRWFPFNSDGSVPFRMSNLLSYFGNFGLSLLPVQSAIAQNHIFFWSPSTNRLWALAPFVIIALVGLRFGIGTLSGRVDNENNR